MRRLVLPAALLLTACGAADDAAVPKALFVIVDGIPADVVEAVDTPTLDSIAGADGYTRAWLGGDPGGASASPTVSAVGYMSLITGTWSNKHNVYDNDVDDPDYAYWDIFRIAKTHDPSLQTAIYSTWTDNRTKLVGDELAAAGGGKIDFHADGYELDEARFPHDEQGEYIRMIDAEVAKQAAAHIRETGPDLSWIYLEYTDWIAHEVGDSPQFEAAVRNMDDLLAPVWRAVQERQANDKEYWLVVVTTDHGRDADTGREHGEQTDRERTIWIVTNSDRLNERFRDNPAIVDILPSIATHMGIDIPGEVAAQLDGRSFID